MIIDSIQLEHVGPFNESVEIGPADGGINVLAAANEAGKSTVVKAAVRCLFDRHTCKDGEIKLLQPAGTELAPRIRVEFRVGDTRYRIAKQFLHSPTSELFEHRDGNWKRVAEADMADSRLIELLGSGKPGRGASKPAHWGMIQYLWGRQGEPATWPDWNGEAGELVRARLAKVEIDPVVSDLADALMTEYSANFTDTGRPRKGGILKDGEDSLERLQAELAEVRRERQSLEDKEIEFQSFQEDLGLLENEHRELEAKAEEFKNTAEKAERVLDKVAALKATKDAAEEKLSAVNRDKDALAKLESQIKKLEEGQKKLSSLGKELADKKKLAIDALEQAKESRAGSQAAVNEAVTSGARVSEILDYRSKLEELKTLDSKLEKVNGLQSELGDLRRKLDALPSVKAGDLKKLEGLEQTVREKQIQIEAQGLHVELIPASASELVVEREGGRQELKLQAKSPETLTAAQEMRLQLAEWGEILVRTGAEEVKELAQTLSDARSELGDALRSFALESVSDAREALDQAKEIKGEMKGVERSLSDALDQWEDAAGMKSAATSLAALTKKLAGQLELSSQEEAASLADLEAQKERIQVTVSASQGKLSELQKAVESAQQGVDDAESALIEHEKKALEIGGELRGQRQRRTDIEERHAEGIAEALQKAQQEFVKAEARYEEKLKELPEDHESLPDRNRRAAKAVGEVAEKLKSKKESFHRLEGELKNLGAGGLYAKETRLLEEIARAEAEVDHARERGWAARLVHDLIAYRKDEATRSVLKPLEDRLSDQFAAITRRPNRRVFLTEDLQIEGIGREDEKIPFDSLSQGAREQLLLSLRLAVTLELAADGPQCLILDDVLVNSDRVRQERIMDVLQAAGEKIQIVILTCHPDWYRGFGNSLQLEEAE